MERNKNQQDQQTENQLDKNETLNSPGANVVDYGRSERKAVEETEQGRQQTSERDIDKSRTQARTAINNSVHLLLKRMQAQTVLAWFYILSNKKTSSMDKLPLTVRRAIELTGLYFFGMIIFIGRDIITPVYCCKL